MEPLSWGKMQISGRKLDLPARGNFLLLFIDILKYWELAHFWNFNILYEFIHGCSINTET